MSDFAGRAGAALVVGGSGGLGRAIAEMLADRGAVVATTYRTNRPASGASYAERAQPRRTHRSAERRAHGDHATAVRYGEFRAGLVAQHGHLVLRRDLGPAAEEVLDHDRRAAGPDDDRVDEQVHLRRPPSSPTS